MGSFSLHLNFFNDLFNYFDFDFYRNLFNDFLDLDLRLGVRYNIRAAALSFKCLDCVLEFSDLLSGDHQCSDIGVLGNFKFAL